MLWQHDREKDLLPCKSSKSCMFGVPLHMWSRFTLATQCHMLSTFEVYGMQLGQYWPLCHSVWTYATG
jgi:hypothetical protein